MNQNFQDRFHVFGTRTVPNKATHLQPDTRTEGVFSERLQSILLNAKANLGFSVS